MDRPDYLKTCDTCRWWRETDKAFDKMQAMGNCHRNPPVSEERNGFARTTAYAFCGEHEPKQTSDTTPRGD